MSVKVLIDLLYDPGKAQQAERDLLKIEQAIAAADKAAQGLTKDYDLAEQRTAGFGQALDAAAGTVTAAAEAVDRAQASLDTLGSGFATAGSGADAAAAAFERTGGALSAIEGFDPFAKLDGSMAKAEGQAHQLGAAIRAIDAGVTVPAGIEAVDAALRDQKLLAEQARAAIEMPATDGALASVEAVNKALQEQLTLEEQVRRLVAEPVPPSPMQAYTERRRAEQEATREAWTFPNGAPVPPIAPREDHPEEAPQAAETAHERVSRQNAETAAVIAAEDREQERRWTERHEERERARLAGKPPKDEAGVRIRVNGAEAP